MAGTETAGQFPRGPIDKLGHAIHEAAVGIGHAVQKHPYRLALASTLATLGIGGTLLLQKVYGPSNVVDNAPYSDTLPPPPEPPSPDQGPAVSVIVPPSSPDSGPSTPPKPPENLMDQALKDGKIDLGTSNSQDYFKGVSPSEAQNNSTPEFPVNPQRNPNLKVANDILTNSRGESFPILNIDNVENDEPFRASEAGTFRIDNVGGGSIGKPYKVARIEIGNKKYFIHIKNANIPEHFIWGKTYQVNAGDILFFVVDKNALLPSDVYKSHQIVVMMQGVNNPDSPIANFVDPATGKIPFIDDSPPGK